MTVGRWSFEKDGDKQAFFIYRNGTIFAVASYGGDNNIYDTEEEVWKGIREMADCIELGRPYVDSMNPGLLD